jgi:hypothetical protein
MEALGVTPLVTCTSVTKWRTAHCFQSKYFKNQARYEKAVLKKSLIILKVLSNETN